MTKQMPSPPAGWGAPQIPPPTRDSIPLPPAAPSPRYDELDVARLLSAHQTCDGQRNLYCPSCGCINGHVKPPYLDRGESWNGNSVLAVVPIHSECGCEWEVCIGEHKGDAPIFARVTKPCNCTPGHPGPATVLPWRRLTS